MTKRIVALLAGLSLAAGCGPTPDSNPNSNANTPNHRQLATIHHHSTTHQAHEHSNYSSTMSRLQMHTTPHMPLLLSKFISPTLSQRISLRGIPSKICTPRKKQMIG